MKHTCTDCQESKPHTREFFYTNGHGTVLRRKCKVCCNKTRARWATSSDPGMSYLQTGRYGIPQEFSAWLSSAPPVAA